LNATGRSFTGPNRSNFLVKSSKRIAMMKKNCCCPRHFWREHDRGVARWEADAYTLTLGLQQLNRPEIKLNLGDAIDE
jgi:hypothetical protein